MLSLVAAIMAVALLAGCDAGGSPSLDSKYDSNTATAMADTKAMFERTKGDYSQLTAEERDKLIKAFSGKEEAAKTYWDKMKAGTANQNIPAPPK